jgi:hypothetical protein
MCLQVGRVLPELKLRSWGTNIRLSRNVEHTLAS